VTLGRQLKALAPGLTARSALEKFAAVQMVDVRIPSADGRPLQLTRYTQPERELELPLERLRLTLPAQPPKISAVQTVAATLLSCRLLGVRHKHINHLASAKPRIREVRLSFSATSVGLKPA
jgi:hypothetical protein